MYIPLMTHDGGVLSSTEVLSRSRVHASGYSYDKILGQLSSFRAMSNVVIRTSLCISYWKVGVLCTCSSLGKLSCRICTIFSDLGQPAATRSEREPASVARMADIGPVIKDIL